MSQASEAALQAIGLRTGAQKQSSGTLHEPIRAMPADMVLCRNSHRAAEAFRGKQVLITGGMGFIGSNLAMRLAGAGAEVTAIDNMLPVSGANTANLTGFEDRIAVHILDIRNTAALRPLLRGKDFLLNLAAHTSHMGSMQDPEMDLDINVRAQVGILEACRQEKATLKIVFASTRQIYGKPDYLPVPELHPVRPVDVNGINKVAAESYHNLYHKVYGIRCCSLRFTNTYGPRMRIKDAKQLFLGYWVRLLLEGEAFEVWGGEQLRDLTYIDDAVDAILMAAVSEEADGEIFNVGAEQPVTLKELADLLIDVHGSGAYVVKEFPAERKRIDIGHYFADYRRIQNKLGWTPTVGLREGLQRTLAYYAGNLSNYI